VDKKRSILRLKRDELVPAEEDRKVELGVYDLLLPCRRFEVSYKVAVLKEVSPTLEFLLRLVKSIPGIGESDVREFFGYSRPEMEYVLSEATMPAYVERHEGRLWLTLAGEGLFSEGERGPSILTVEDRDGSFGFDLLSLSPERPRRLDETERWLPDIGLEEDDAAGNASKRIPDRFRRFFREFSERRDREQVQRRDLYSVDDVKPGERYQIAIRVRVHAQASSPTMGELDLTSWRPDHESAERPEVERAAGRFLEELRVSANPQADASAYQRMIELAPDFFKDFTIRSGLSVNRFWREAVSRAGDVRTDRRTVPMVGALPTLPNVERLLKVIEYGERQSSEAPMIISVAPQNRHWGATSLWRDAMNVLLKRKPAADIDDADRTVCIVIGRPPAYLKHAFDTVESIDRNDLPPALELLLIPNVCACALVHAPIGAPEGMAAPLGFASFDADVLARTHALLEDTVLRYMANEALRSRMEKALHSGAEAEGAEPI